MSSKIPTFTKETVRVLSYALRAVAALHVFTSSCFELSQTEGASMLPTLQVQNDFCIVDKRFKYGRGIEMGDMIVARKPTQPESWICKRITGMPGDIILIDPSKDSLNELKIEEDSDANNNIKEIKINKIVNSPFNQYIIVPEGHVWVTGDNLSDSVDSRTYSVLPLGLINGKIIIASFFPDLLKLKRNYFRWLDNAYYEENFYE